MSVHLDPRLVIPGPLEFWIDGKFKGMVSKVTYEAPPEEDIQSFSDDLVLTTVSSVPTLIVELEDMKDVYHLQHGYKVEYDESGWARKIMMEWQDNDPPLVHDLQDVLPGLLEKTKCPICLQDEDIAKHVPGLALWNVIIHVNDEHRKSREWIADWLERLDIDLRFREVNDDNSND